MDTDMTLDFWKNMALGLKDELVERGNRIAELEAQLVSVSRALVSTDNADRYYRGFNDGFDHAKAQGAYVPLEDGEYPMVENAESDEDFLYVFGNTDPDVCTWVECRGDTVMLDVGMTICRPPAGEGGGRDE